MANDGGCHDEEPMANDAGLDAQPAGPSAAGQGATRRPRAHTTPEILSYLMPGQGSLPRRSAWLKQDFLENRFKGYYYGSQFSLSYGPRSPNISVVLDNILTKMWAKHTERTQEARPQALLLSSLSQEVLAPILDTGIIRKRGLCCPFLPGL